MATHTVRGDNWSRFWRSGSMHSLDGSLGNDYGGSFHAFWSSVLLPLQSGMRVLDIGTGNGALPLLIHSLHGDAMPSVDAIDLAAVSMDWLLSRSQSCRAATTVHPHVAAEALPFADGTFDLVVSQYGFEYADPGLAAQEVARVLKATGNVALLLHHSRSRLAHVAGEELRLVEWLLAPAGFMACAEEIYPYMALAGSPLRNELPGNAAADGARARYNAAMRSLGELAASSQVPDVLLETRAFVASQVQRTAASGHAEEAVASHREHMLALRDAAFRQAELRDHALDDAQVEALAERFRSHGLAANYQPISYEGHLMGWTLQASRR